ncbi:hypothetical protein QPL79_05495 [Ignisphaera sp. 4213-co]|uniref:DUF4350 domain-containing protein n=1 Tax=Ignisphaera cupida TaxID=3050454 RepID=A0ABD4Z732_9CREN|nr:hypothetical protein [Ignisphaera sp. 4213-co]MDK6028812.1 hypothetical protein [Ignisphaera sp. 4213-co]
MNKLKTVAAVAISTILALLAIGLIAVAEKGPSQIQIFVGASPFNTGLIGTFKFVEMLRTRYSMVYVISSLSELRKIFTSGTCLFIAVSPEVGYSKSDAETVGDALSKCKYASILVADESTTSNALLETLETSIRVNGKIIIDAVNGPYIYAYISIQPNASTHKVYYLQLDIASQLKLEFSKAKPVGYADTGDVVAAEELSPLGVHVFVLGDGSIFLNQVLESNKTVYKDFAIDLVNYLCRYDGGCKIVVDGSRYPGYSLDKALENKNMLVYADPIAFAAAFATRLLHPSTWLLPAIEFLNSFFKNIASMYNLFIAILAALSGSIYIFLEHRMVIVDDRRLDEQREVEVFATGDVREAILKGKIKLGKQDFLNLFTIVNTVTQLVYGVELCNPRLFELIPSREYVKRYVNRMCKLRKKASEGGFLPIVFSWSRTTAKMVRESEEFLSLLGQSIAGEKGFEYLLMR